MYTQRHLNILPNRVDRYIDDVLNSLDEQFAMIAKTRNLVDALCRKVFAEALDCARLEEVHQQYNQNDNHIQGCTPEKVAAALIDNVKTGIISKQMPPDSDDVFEIIAQYLLNVVFSAYGDDDIYMLYLSDEDVICVAEALLRGASEKELVAIITVNLLAHEEVITTSQSS